MGVLRASNGNPAILVDLGKLYRRMKRLKDARRVLSEALRIKPELKGARDELNKVVD